VRICRLDYLGQNRDNCSAVLNTVMNLGFQKGMRFLTLDNGC
jgi:hypothetical protein